MKTKNRIFSSIALVLIISALLVAAANVATTKAQTTASVDILPSVGGTTSPNGTQTGTVGQTMTVTATPGMGFMFLAWIVANSGGATTSTSTTLSVNVTSSGCAVQAMFLPMTNYTGTGSGTGSSTFDVLTSVGGATTPNSTSTVNIGQSVMLTATPGNGFKCIGWVVATAAGATDFTTPTVNYNVTSSGCAWQALFVPTDSAVTIPEYSNVGVAVLAIALVAVAAGTFVATRRIRK
jgi:hypothetical protein